MKFFTNKYFIFLSVAVGLFFLNPSAPLVLADIPPGATIYSSGGCALTDFKGLVDCINNSIINPLIALTVGIGVVVFLWGVVKYIAQGDKPEEKKKGLVMIGWGILGLFIMVSVWGLVNILTQTFFGGNIPSSPPIPTLSI